MKPYSNGELAQMEQAGKNAEHCVCCGDIIPEGRQVCPICEKMQFPPDYIDRRKLTAKMRELISTRLFNEEDMLDLVNEQPRADVVEVVRCKDCLEAKETVSGRYSCFLFAGTNDGNWYCADGKRRKDNDRRNGN